MGRKYSTVLTIVLIIIIIAVICLIAFLGYNFFSNRKNTTEAENFVSSFSDDVGTEVPDAVGTEYSQGIGGISSNNNPVEGQVQNGVTGDPLTNEQTTNNNNNNNNNNGVTPTKATVKKPQYKGYNTVGTIEIPKISLSYPVLEKETDASLKVAVAVEWPASPVLNEPGNVVIAGHNYRNGTLFSNVKKLSVGDPIYVTDLNKKKMKYIIYKIEERTPNDVEFYNRDTNGAREITLKTCTDDVQRRIFVLAKEA